MGAIPYLDGSLGIKGTAFPAVVCIPDREQIFGGMKGI